MVGSLFSWKSLLTKRRTSEDLPTAASPRRTSLTEVVGLEGGGMSIFMFPFLLLLQLKRAVCVTSVNA